MKQHNMALALFTENGDLSKNRDGKKEGWTDSNILHKTLNRIVGWSFLLSNNIVIGFLGTECDRALAIYWYNIYTYSDIILYAFHINQSDRSNLTK